MKYACFDIFPLALPTVAALLLCVIHPPPLQAEEKGLAPVAVGVQATSPTAALSRRWQTNQTEQGHQGQYYFIKRPSVGGQLTYEFKEESRTHGGTTIRDTNHQFKEKIGIKTAGWVYHPALMQYSLLLEPELSQEKEEMSPPGGSAETSSFAPDYSMTATFLEPKPYTLNIFAKRQEEPVWAAFTGNTDLIVDSYGATGQLEYRILPTTLGYTYTETDQTGFYRSQNIHEEFNLSSRHQTGKSTTRLSSTYSDDKRTSEGYDSRIKTFNNSLFNNYDITGDNIVKLNSALTYRTQESGWFDTQNIHLREHLNWRHRPNLQSNYSVSHSRQESDDFDSDMTALEVRLTHLLYENLTTNTGGRGHRYNYSDGNENAANGFLDFSYSRPLSWATLGLHAGWDYLYTDRSGATAADALVTDETHSLSLGEEIYLDNYDIYLDSIIVTNTEGTIVYFENIDYTIEEINGFVRISRLPFGSIADGQIVAVDYRHLRNSEYDDALFTENYGINFDLWHDWRFSYNFLRVTQDILSDQAPPNLVDDTMHKADVRYDIGWSNSSFSYEDHNRLSAPSYTQWEIQETLSYRSQRRFYFSVKGYFGQANYEDRDETREFYGGITTVDLLLRRWCKLRVEGYYEMSTTGDIEETENNGLKAGLEFRYRIWTARLSYEFTDQNYQLTDYRRTEHLARLEFIRLMW
jgi:hypothetical protein